MGIARGEVAKLTYRNLWEFPHYRTRWGVMLAPDRHIPRGKLIPFEHNWFLLHPETFEQVRCQLKFDAWMAREERR